MKAPIYIYYQLDNFYQNHRRYIKSRSDQQLLHGLKYNDTSSCQPEEFSNGHPIVPCGLIAWSLFNDTYKFIRGRSELRINRKNIAWKSDRDHKFGKHVYPLNFQNGTLIGGGSLDPSIPVSISNACKFKLTPLYLFYRSQICFDRPNYDILYPLESTPTCCGLSNFSSPLDVDMNYHQGRTQNFMFLFSSSSMSIWRLAKKGIRQWFEHATSIEVTG